VTNDPNLPVENGPVPVRPVAAPNEDLAGILSSNAGSNAGGNRPAQTGLQLWLHRSSVFLFVLISAIAGVLLVILPWTPEWTDNSLLLSFPWLRSLVTTGFFRGLCSGLGMLDIWIGFWEALHYHDRQ
jgi:hypothetical protein